MSDPVMSPNVRREAARRVAATLLARRAAGEEVSDAAELTAHPELHPELREELEHARRIRLGVAAGERVLAQASADGALSWSALERPIEEGEEEADVGSDPTPRPGVKPQVAGYLVLHEIGRGGQGTVYRAVQESTDRPVAIKVIAGRAGSRHRTRIEREARLLASLRHPHIVGIIERTQTSTGLFCLVMEFVEGCDLDAWWTGLPPGQGGTRALLDLFTKLAEAIGAMHRAGIVHRDLKPSNVRVDAQGEPRILDFGLARATAPAAALTPGTITMTGQILGSLPWASPEQAGGNTIEVGPASDVYSLGVMLYQALTGRFPYPVDGAFLDLLIHISRTIPAPPRSVPGARPTGLALDRVLLRALDKRPAERFADGNQLAEAMHTVLRAQGNRGTAGGTFRRATSIALAAGLCTLNLSTRWVPPPPVPSRLGGGQTIIELPRLTNSIGMSLIRVPVGRFVMGSATGEEGLPEGSPQRLVTIASPYYLGSTEVTRRQYFAVMHADPSDPKWAGAELPVQRVTWHEAREFCRRLSVLEGRHYRLPTSAEWEYACRAGTADRFGESGSMDSVGWYAANSGGAVHPVGGKSPNVWGFYDAHGNVAEWCSDVFTPVPGRSLAVIRGGSALRTAADCRAASVMLVTPEGRFSDLGFRVARDP